MEVNGLGMGFTLFKLDIFKDKRFKKPWFKTVSDHGKNGPRQYTQDLWAFEKLRALGYKHAVNTMVKLGHLSFQDGRIY